LINEDFCFHFGPFLNCLRFYYMPKLTQSQAFYAIIFRIFCCLKTTTYASLGFTVNSSLASLPT
jgi:hypothetical protein